MENFIMEILVWYEITSSIDNFYPSIMYPKDRAFDYSYTFLRILKSIIPVKIWLSAGKFQPHCIYQILIQNIVLKSSKSWWNINPLRKIISKLNWLVKPWPSRTLTQGTQKTSVRSHLDQWLDSDLLPRLLLNKSAKNSNSTISNNFGMRFESS